MTDDASSTGPSTPGVPCLIDTEQPDPEAAAEFYSGLFGWEFENKLPPGIDNKYLVASLHGFDVAAIASPTPGREWAAGLEHVRECRRRRRHDGPGGRRRRAGSRRAGRCRTARRHRRPLGGDHRPRRRPHPTLAARLPLRRTTGQWSRHVELDRPDHRRSGRRERSTAHCSGGRRIRSSSAAAKPTARASCGGSPATATSSQSAIRTSRSVTRSPGSLGGSATASAG